MPKKRRKLNKDMERAISQARKRVEFITARINDIDEEDIQQDYRLAFDQVILVLANLSAEYDLTGFTETTDNYLHTYNGLLAKFEEDYEI